jgi:hypothetical protein
VIRHLRERAAATRLTSKLFLAMLVVSVVLGLTFYLGLPFWQTWADGRQKALEETLAGITARKGVLDAERKALLTSGTLENGTKADHLPTMLENSFMPVEIAPDQVLQSIIVHDDDIYLFGSEGSLLRFEPDAAVTSVVPTMTDAWLYDAEIYRDDLYIFGDGGVLLRLKRGASTTERLETSTDFALFDGIVHDGRLYIYGDSGTLLLLGSPGSDVEQLPTGTGASIHTAVSDGSRLYFLDTEDQIRKLSADGSRLELAPISLPSDTDGFGAFSAGGEIYFYGSSGRLFRVAPDRNRLEVMNTGTDADLAGGIFFAGRLYVYGMAGTILVGTLDGSQFETIPTMTTSVVDGAAIHKDRLYFFANGGKVFRLSADGTAVRELPTGTMENVWDGVTHGDHLYLIGDLSTLLAQPRGAIRLAATLPVSSSPQDLAAVEAFFASLPPHILDWDPIRDLRDQLRLVAAERAGLDRIETRTKDELGRLLANPLQYLRERKALDFDAFLRTCRPEAASSEITTACLTAWQTEQAQAQRSWWEALTDQLPPGILLLFLLATLGGLYRYNVRLAGFHESRADFLTLLSYGRSEAELRDILASNQGEAVNLATMVLAADKVEMGAIKARLGQAEIELAKALAGNE